MTVIVDIDPGRHGDIIIPARLDDVHGTTTVGDQVALRAHGDTYGTGWVRRFDLVNRLVYLDVDWNSFTREGADTMDTRALDQLRLTADPTTGDLVLVDPPSRLLITLAQVTYPTLQVTAAGIIIPTPGGPATYRILEACGPANMTLLCERD